MIVKTELEKLGLHCNVVELGVVEIAEEITSLQRQQLKSRLQESGLDLQEDKKGILIDQIKAVIMELILHENELPRLNYATCLSERLNCKYNYLSGIFMEISGTTIQQFTILQKVERVKRLLVQGKLQLSEISHRLNYSSVAHLSNQFKKITGPSPSYYVRDYKLAGTVAKEYCQNT